MTRSCQPFRNQGPRLWLFPSLVPTLLPKEEAIVWKIKPENFPSSLRSPQTLDPEGMGDHPPGDRYTHTHTHTHLHTCPLGQVAHRTCCSSCTHFKMARGGGWGKFLSWLSGLRTRLVSMRMQVRSLASLSGLRIWRCHDLWCRLQTLLRSCIAVAAA